MDWQQIKATGLPALVVLPALIWHAVCCAALQALCLLLIPLGMHKEYTAAVRLLFTVMHRPLLYLWEYSDSRIYVYSDADVEASILGTIGSNQSMICSNHRGDLDWLVGLLVQDNGGGLGSCKAIVKRSLLYVPFFGVSWWSADFICISRNWKSDSARLDAGYKRQHEYRQWAIPYCLTIFPEGTRLTAEKLKESQEFCKSRGLPRLENALCPRVKGMWSAINGLQLDTVYDTTIVAGEAAAHANMLTLAQGKAAEIHVHMRRVDPKEIPREEEGLNAWLMKRWEEKDARLARFQADGHLGGDAGSSRRKTLLVRPAARLGLLGAVLWWLFCVTLFAYWCVSRGHQLLLAGALGGTILMVALLGFILQQVHFKKSTQGRKSK
eukprot:TRINITY_DN21196_c0_g2_i1.p1 TRINITY_DN21196_c0_g2~~TRINITY_DN21196_c0_g2_i1.p1  ORF type:complete len:391 (-),score=78.39 TRINITY_DN21196_c0_g2_i1:57-1202(-)